LYHPALGSLPRLALYDLDGTGGFLPPDEVLGPPPAMKGGINQFGSGIGFAQAHALTTIYPLIFQAFTDNESDSWPCPDFYKRIEKRDA
jgi:hypothetical protein